MSGRGVKTKAGGSERKRGSSSGGGASKAKKHGDENNGRQNPSGAHAGDGEYNTRQHIVIGRYQ